MTEIEEGVEAELVGVVYVDRAVVGTEARAHYVFFDGKLSDKTEFLRGMIEQQLTRFHRLTVEVPEYMHALIRHAKRLGFAEEGRKREGWKHDGRWADVVVMGIVSEEE